MPVRPEWRSLIYPTGMEHVMQDILYIGIIVAFFAVSYGLVRFCASLLNGGKP